MFSQISLRPGSMICPHHLTTASNRNNFDILLCSLKCFIFSYVLRMAKPNTVHPKKSVKLMTSNQTAIKLCVAIRNLYNAVSFSNSSVSKFGNQRKPSCCRCAPQFFISSSIKLWPVWRVFIKS